MKKRKNGSQLLELGETITNSKVASALSKMIEETRTEYVYELSQKVAALNMDDVPDDARITDYAAGLPEACNQQTAFIQRSFSPEFEDRKTERDIELIEADKKEREEQMKEIERKLSPKKAKINENMKGYLHEMKVWRNLIHPLVIAVSFGEVLLNYPAFQTIAGNLLSSIGLAGFAGVIIYAYADLAGTYLKKFEDKHYAYQALMSAIASLPIASLFYGIALMRSGYMNAMNTSTHGMSNPYIYMVISLVGYSVCQELVTKYKPSAELKKQYAAYRDDKKEIAKLEAAKSKLNREEAAQNKNHITMSTNRDGWFYEAAQLENEVVNNYHLLISELKMEMLTRNPESSKLFRGITKESFPTLKTYFNEN